MWLRRKTLRFILLATVIGAISGTGLWLYWPSSVLSKEEVIHTALRPVGSSPLPMSQVTGVKLIHRFDLGRVAGQGQSANTKPWDRVWVVVIKGMLIAPSFPSGRTITYTLEVIPDQKPSAVELYYEDGPGNLPAAWSDVIDLSGS